MTTTGPLPAIKVTTRDERLQALGRMGMTPGTGVWYGYPTADAVVDTLKGVLFIAVDMDPDPADWVAICRLITMTGYDNGTWPHSDDPGVPGFDVLTAVNVWRLEYV